MGLTHLIVDRSDTAKKAFAGVGLAYAEAEVLQLELPNTPGALGGLPASLLKKTSTSPWATRQARRGPRRRYFGHGLRLPGQRGALRPELTACAEAGQFEELKPRRWTLTLFEPARAGGNLPKPPKPDCGIMLFVRGSPP